MLGLEHGVTYSADGSAFTLNSAVAGAVKDASITGTEMVLRSTLSYAAASRALAAGPTAFESSTKHLVGNMHRSLSKRLEMGLLYGQMGIGTVLTNTAGALVIVTAQWAPGIWAGAEGMVLEAFDATLATQHNTDLTVTNVNLDTRTITVSGTSAAVVATDILFPKGAMVAGPTHNQFAGIHKIMTNTGTLFGISATTYNLWKSNEYSAGSAALSITKIQSAIARGVEKGLDRKVKCFVNPKAWSDMINAEVARRTYDGSYKPGEMENGAESLKFHGQNGIIEVVPSTYVKEGFAYILVMEDLIRIGSTSITFKRPGQGDQFFRDLEASAGYELRAYCDEAVFCCRPGEMILIKDVVNTV